MLYWPHLGKPSINIHWCFALNGVLIGSFISTRYYPEKSILGNQIHINDVIGNLDIFPLILMSDIFNINELTQILKITIPSDVKHIIMLPMKPIMSDLKVVTYIITRITARPIRLTEILAIMSVSTFKTDFILYVNKSKSYLLRDLLVDDTFPESNVNSDFWKYIRNSSKLHLNIACL